MTHSESVVFIWMSLKWVHIIDFGSLYFSTVLSKKGETRSTNNFLEVSVGFRLACRESNIASHRNYFSQPAFSLYFCFFRSPEFPERLKWMLSALVRSPLPDRGDDDDDRREGDWGKTTREQQRWSKNGKKTDKFMNGEHVILAHNSDPHSTSALLSSYLSITELKKLKIGLNHFLFWPLKKNRNAWSVSNICYILYLETLLHHAHSG